MTTPAMTTALTRARLTGAVAVTPRPLAAYRDMFMLTDDDLRAGPILDCPAGASPFGAQVRALGGEVVSVDPAWKTKTAFGSPPAFRFRLPVSPSDDAEL